jgi:rhodanese-related sulfurtransferase
MSPTSRHTTAAVAVAIALTLSLMGCGSSSSGGSSGAGVTGSGGASATTVDGIQRLDVSAFAALAAAPTTVVLDVRTPAEFASGHLDRAQLVDFEAADFDVKIATLDKNVTYAIYCRSGNRSGQALGRMQAAGFTHVADLRNGINAWRSEGRAVVSA